MDDFEYSVHISEQDWESFFHQCEECDVLPAALAGVDDSGMSDTDEVGSQLSDRAPRPIPGTGIPDLDLLIDGPPDCEGSPVELYLSKYGLCSPEHVLSGSEEDIHLQSVNLFFERLKSVTENEQPSKLDCPAEGRATSVQSEVYSDQKNITERKSNLPVEMALLNPMFNSNQTVEVWKGSMKPGDSNSEDKVDPNKVPEPTVAESGSETDGSTASCIEPVFREEDWSVGSTIEGVKLEKEVKSYNPSKEVERKPDPPNAGNSQYSVLADGKGVSEPIRGDEAASLPILKNIADSKESPQVSQGQSNSSSRRRKQSKKKKIIEPVDPGHGFEGQFLCNQGESDDEGCTRRAETDRDARLSGQHSAAKVAETGSEPKCSSPQPKIDSSSESLPICRKSLLGKTSVTEPVGLMATDLPKTDITGTTQDTGNLYSPNEKCDLTEKPASARQFVSDACHRSTETNLPAHFKGTERFITPALLSDDSLSTPNDGDNVADHLQLNRTLPLEAATEIKESGMLPASITTCSAVELAPVAEVSDEVKTENSLLALSPADSEGLNSQPGRTMLNDSTALLKSEPTCPKEPNKLNRSTDSRVDSLSGQSQVGKEEMLSPGLNVKCDTVGCRQKAYSSSELSESTHLATSLESDAIKYVTKNQLETTSSKAVPTQSRSSVPGNSDRFNEFCLVHPANINGLTSDNSHPCIQNMGKASNEILMQDGAPCQNGDKMKDIKASETADKTDTEVPASKNCLPSHICLKSFVEKPSLFPYPIKEDRHFLADQKSAVLSDNTVSESLIKSEEISCASADKRGLSVKFELTSPSGGDSNVDSHSCNGQTMGSIAVAETNGTEPEHTMNPKIEISQTSENTTGEGEETELHNADISQECASSVQELSLKAHGGTPDSSSPLPESISRARTPEWGELDTSAQATHPVYAISSFWDEMEKLTINDILRLRMVSSSQYSGVLATPEDSNVADPSDAADSGYFTHLDESRPGRSSGDMSCISDFYEELSSLQTQDTSKQGGEEEEVSLESSNLDRDVTWESVVDPVAMAAEMEDVVILSSETTLPQPLLADGARLFLRKMCKNISVQNLQTLEAKPLRKIVRNASLHSIHSEAEDDNAEPFSRMDASSPVHLPDEEEIESCGISFSEIFKYLFGGKEPECCVPGEDNMATASYIDDTGTSVPEMYDHFFSEFEAGSFFYPLVEESSSSKDEMVPIFSSTCSAKRDLQFPEAYDYFFPDSPVQSDEESSSSEDELLPIFSCSHSVKRDFQFPEAYDYFFPDSPVQSDEESGGGKDELVPIFSCSHSAKRDLQFPETHDYFFPDDSPVQSDEDEDFLPIRVVTRHDLKATEHQHTVGATNVYKDFSPEGGLRGSQFWKNPFSLRRVRRTGFPVHTERSSSWALTPVNKNEMYFRRPIQPINAMGYQDKPFPDPLLCSLENRIFRQLADQQKRCPEMQIAVADPRLDAPLSPLKQSDLCLVCIAFASWVLKTANPGAADAWKAALLANISALSAIRYLRRYKKEEATGKNPLPQILPA